MIDGFSFSREKVRPHTIRWICNQAWVLNCKVRATSEKMSGKLISVRGAHNHGVVSSRRKWGQCKFIKEQCERDSEQSVEPPRKGGRPKKQMEQWQL
ncbi:hypothetical protein RP20_CCG001715 [Aedes albopictus]|nr:hypothetical protein RP20_CCG001715 [Aedes albopictus]